MSVDIDIEQAEIDKAVDRVLSVILLAGTQTVRAGTRALEKGLEDATRAGVKGKLWRAWKSETYPSRDVGAYNPAGEVFVNGRARSQGAMAYWTQAGFNRASDGGWRAIPTDAAGVLGRQRNLTPEEWERRHGVDLRFVPGAHGEAARLVAEQIVFNSGRVSPVQRKAKAGRSINKDGSAAFRTDVTIFVLIPYQRFANKVSINGMIQRAISDLPNDFDRRVRAGFGRNS